MIPKYYFFLVSLCVFPSWSHYQKIYSVCEQAALWSRKTTTTIRREGERKKDRHTGAKHTNIFSEENEFLNISDVSTQMYEIFVREGGWMIIDSTHDKQRRGEQRRYGRNLCLLCKCRKTEDQIEIFLSFTSTLQGLTTFI